MSTKRKMKRKKTIKRRRFTYKGAKVFIGMPCPLTRQMDTGAAAFVIQAREQGICNIFYPVPGRNVEDSRNVIIRKFLEFKECTHLFWQDADTVPPDFAIERLLSHDKPVIAGITPIYKSELPPHGYWFWSAREKKPDGKYRLFEIDELRNETKIRKVDGLGGTTVLVRRDVIERMKEPYFKTERNPEDNKVILSEDFYHTKKIQDMGFDLWIDPTIQCKHIQTQDIDRMNRSLVA